MRRSILVLLLCIIAAFDIDAHQNHLSKPGDNLRRRNETTRSKTNLPPTDDRAEEPMKFLNDIRGRLLSSHRHLLTSDSEREHIEYILRKSKDQIFSSDEELASKDGWMVESRKRFFDGYFQNMTQDLPVIILQYELGFPLGNNFGRLLVSLGCAHIAGLHAIIINLMELHDGLEKEAVFYRLLPKVIVHENPAPSYDVGKQSFLDSCGTLNRDVDVFPWSIPDELGPILPVKQMIPYWRQLIQPPLMGHMASMGVLTGEGVGISTTSKNPDGSDHIAWNSLLLPADFYESKKMDHIKLWDAPGILSELNVSLDSNAESLLRLPRHPDVTIHYRCSDNVFFFAMGLLPFHSIIKYIPADAKYIYITSEYYVPDSDNPCLLVVKALQTAVKRHRPHAHVIHRSGGDAFLVADMFMESKVVICSASTFCFHFAVANPSGIVWLPIVDIFYGRKNSNNMTCCQGEAKDNKNNIFTMEDVHPIWKFHFENGTEFNNWNAGSARDVIAILSAGLTSNEASANV